MDFSLFLNYYLKYLPIIMNINVRHQAVKKYFLELYVHKVHKLSICMCISDHRIGHAENVQTLHVDDFIVDEFSWFREIMPVCWTFAWYDGMMDIQWIALCLTWKHASTMNSHNEYDFMHKLIRNTLILTAIYIYLMCRILSIANGQWYDLLVWLWTKLLVTILDNKKNQFNELSEFLHSSHKTDVTKRRISLTWKWFRKHSSVY